jgi:hypothetical protein
VIVKRIVVLAVLALLGACNMVVTTEPVFAPADGRGAPAMRPGVWAGEPNPGCQRDEAKPLSQWAACANGFVVLDDRTIGGFSDESGKHAWTTTDFVLASGKPRVFQVHITGDDPLMPSAFVYAGFEPTKLDDAGHIVAGQTWFVICGPPPPPTQVSGSGGDSSQPHPGTLHPFAGLTMDKDGANCTPASPDALRNAARGSHALTAPKDISSAHWVRDGRD